MKENIPYVQVGYNLSLSRQNDPCTDLLTCSFSYKLITGWGYLQGCYASV